MNKHSGATSCQIHWRLGSLRMEAIVQVQLSQVVSYVRGKASCITIRKSPVLNSIHNKFTKLEKIASTETYDIIGITESYVPL